MSFKISNLDLPAIMYPSHLISPASPASTLSINQLSNMPRLPLSYPPPLSSNHWERQSDVENEPPTAFNVRRHGPTNRKLFFTPTQKSSTSPSPTLLLTRDSITRRYFKQHENEKTPIKTPLPRRPSNAPSTSRRPKITRLDDTPSMNRTLPGSAPDRWRNRQITDLTAWLNHELSAGSDAPSLPLHQVASSVVFLKQFAAFNAIYRSKHVHKVLNRVTDEICSGRLNVSKSIKLASFLKEREELISLLLLNYHPHWLLLALSVVLGINLATDLDEAVEKASSGGKSFTHEQVLMQALENSIRNHFLADAPSDPVASRGQTSPGSQERDRYNGLILRRTLVLIYISDVAKKQQDPIIKPEPPLFRSTSQMTSSVDVLRELQKLLLNDHSDIVKFLSPRGYSVSYKSPVYEPFGNLRIVKLSEDIRDGTRLCKLASIMCRNHQILTQVIRIGPGHRPAQALAIKKQNITIALNAMKEFLPPSLRNRFQWHGTAHDIAIGNLDKTISVVWQIAALWMEYVVVDNKKLEEELETVRNAFRIARCNPDSPSRNVHIEDNFLVDSPSKLQIIESCDTNSAKLLLTWCATLCGIYGVEIRDFTEDFRDGAALCLILHHYCPELMQMDEINSIPAGDNRGAFAAEAEHKHVQKNLDLFMDRCRLLGTIPEILLTAEATLAPAFRDSWKQESVGRVMQLLGSYLFRRMMMQKDTVNARQEVWKIMENRKGSVEMEVLQEADSVCEAEVHQRGEMTEKSLQSAREDQSAESFQDYTESFDSATSDLGSDLRGPVQVDPELNRISGGNDNGSAHVYTRMRHVQSRRETRPRSSRPRASQMEADRRNAGQVILAHYRGHKARQNYALLRRGILDLQSSFRRYGAMREVERVRAIRNKDEAENESSQECQKGLSPPLMTRGDSPMKHGDESLVAPSENMRSFPIRIGQQILAILPAVRRYMLAIDSYSSRMIAHEKAAAERHAATVIQSATRSHLAQRARVRVEAERHQTRQTWTTCAVEAAKTALRIADEQRREFVKWHEQLLTNALHTAGNKFDVEMSKAQAVQRELAVQQRKLSEMNALREFQFEDEVRQRLSNYQEQMAEMEESIKHLKSRATAFDVIPASSIEPEAGEKVLENLAQALDNNNAQEDALRLIITDLNTERERADRLEVDLRNLQGRDREAEMQAAQIQGEWEQRFQSLEADVEDCHKTLLNGAICLATANHRLYMNELESVRLKEEQERVAWGEELEKGLAKFAEEEEEECREHTEVLTSLDGKSDSMKQVILAYQSWEEKRDEKEALVAENQLAIGKNLEVLCEKSRQEDIAWTSATKEFSEETEASSRLIGDYEKTEAGHDGQIEILDREIKNLVGAELRRDMEIKLSGIIERAEEAYHKEMLERDEENENMIFCRQEIEAQLHQENREEVVDTEEFEKSMHSIKHSLDMAEDWRSELDEHLNELDLYIDHLFAITPSKMGDDEAGPFAEENIDEVNECSTLWNRTCELIEEVYADIDHDELAEIQENWASISPAQEPRAKSPSIACDDVSDKQENETIEDDGYESEDDDDLESIDRNTSFSTRSGLYQRLVAQEVDYYNGKTTHDIGVQIGSGPNFLPASPERHGHSEDETQRRSDVDDFPFGEEQSSPEYVDKLSAEKQASSLSAIRYSNQSSSDCENLSRSASSEDNGSFSSSRSTQNANSSEAYTLETPQQCSTEHGAGVVEQYGLTPLGPLNTLAQLALQDAEGNEIFEPCNSSGKDAQNPTDHLFPSSQGYTPTANGEKENFFVDSALSATKSSGSKFNGLYIDSPLRTWNSPMWAQSSDEGKERGLIEKEATAQLTSVSSSLNKTFTVPNEQMVEPAPDTERFFRQDYSNDLGELSVELNALNIQPYRHSVESVVQDPSSGSKLQSVMRRISIAASSPNVKSQSRPGDWQERQGPHFDIIRTIFTLIRYCSRSEEQLRLRKLGISIISDFCTVQRRVADILNVEECVDVLTTCLQYHRDQDLIFEPTMRVLWEIAKCPEGKKLIAANHVAVARLRNVNDLLVSHIAREQKNRDRIRQASMIVDIVRKRRAEGGSLKSMAEALRSARDQPLNSEVPMKDAHRLLVDLLEIVP